MLATQNQGPHVLPGVVQHSASQWSEALLFASRASARTTASADMVQAATYVGLNDVKFSQQSWDTAVSDLHAALDVCTGQ
jgi:hypothetical protein